MGDTLIGDPIAIELETTLSAICPACEDGDFRISQSPGRYGPWGCKSCGARWMFDIDIPKVAMTRVAIDEVPGWLITRLGDAEPPLYVITDQPFYAHSAHESPEDRAANTRYWIEESTCPTNIVPVEALVQIGHEVPDDPHGILTFVGHVRKADWPGEHQPDAGWAAIIDHVRSAR